MIWAKVRMRCPGKRHWIHDIGLTEEEEKTLLTHLENFDDPYFLFCVNHERATNPHYPS
jgi:hypothetical protein